MQADWEKFIMTNMFQVECEWGRQGVWKLSADCEVTIIVDVLSFSTTVDIAVSRGIEVLPYDGSKDEAPTFARKHRAELAQRRGGQGYSLSPASFISSPLASRVVLPSPNGSALTLAAAESTIVLCGCIRNASAIANACNGVHSIGVVAAGERWPDGSLRPAIEDWLGAGAIISALAGSLSPEAKAAEAAFHVHADNLLGAIRSSPSGQELIDKGFGQDVELACHLNASRSVPRFNTPSYR